MKKPSLKELRKQIDDFNSKYEVGDSVILLLDEYKETVVKIKEPASILGNHSAVAWFEGVPGCYEINRVTPLRNGSPLFDQLASLTKPTLKS